MNGQRPVALVTGASSGIGTEIALELARRGYDLVLNGRSVQRLEQTAGLVKQEGAAAELVVADLSTPEGVADVVAKVEGRALSLLVNNAGFGYAGDFAEMDAARAAGMVALNVTAVTTLTRAVLPGMVERRDGRILNLASTAAFSPTPHMAVYGATKAYVLSFSEALSTELAGTGVTVTALCPGATETSFAQTAELEGARLFRGAMSARAVAQRGVRALLRGRRSLVPGLRNFLLAFTTRLTPRSIAAAVAGSMLRTS